jgi:hypothetical protein
MTLQPKKRPKLENMFAPRSPLEFVGYSIVGTMIGLFSAGNPIGLIGVPGMAILWWWIDRQRPQREVKIVIEKERPTGAKGLILLLSPYSSRNPDLQDSVKLQSLIDEIINIPTENLKEEKFQDIGLSNSNLMPQVKAAEYHVGQGKLRDIWLISSESYESVKGSELTAKILEKYLKCLYGSQLDIHCGAQYTVRDYDYTKLCQLAEDIFKTSGYRDEVVVADVTGGTKMMSVALAMACIPPTRRMQYMDSQRDWQGNHLAKGNMEPVLIDVDPIFYSSQE